MALLSREPQGPLDYGRRAWLKALFAVILVMLYAPIFTLIAFSFNTDRRGIVWRGFTFDNYVKAWNNASLLEALVNSLAIAVITTLVATVIGSMVALLLWRFRFPLKSAYEGFMALPIVIPEICMGVSLLLFFANSGMAEWAVRLPRPLNLINIIIAHIAFCFPFVAVVVRSRLVGFNRELEEASKDLGASEFQTFRYVLVPFMMPGIVAGALLAFTLSLDDLVISSFTAGPGATTLPMLIFSKVKLGVTPDINALATIIVLVVAVGVAVAGWLMFRAERQRERDIQMAIAANK